MALTESRPHSLSPRGLAIAGWVALAVFGSLFLALAWSVSSQAPLVDLDLRVARWMAAHRSSDSMMSFMLAVTHGNSLAAIGGWSVLFGAVLLAMRERYWLLTLTLAVGGGMLLNLVLKLAYERARPAAEYAVVSLGTYSFPSGHTASSTVFYGVLGAFIVSRLHDSALRVATVAAAIAAIALVAFSRVYLGAHYLSDVLAAFCSSTVWLVLCLSGVHALVRRRMAASA